MIEQKLCVFCGSVSFVVVCLAWRFGHRRGFRIADVFPARRTGKRYHAVRRRGVGRHDDWVPKLNFAFGDYSTFQPPPEIRSAAGFTALEPARGVILRVKTYCCSGCGVKRHPLRQARLSVPGMP